MNKKKKYIWIFVACIIICGFCVRFYFVNKDLKLAVVKEYNIGEQVPYEKDFTETSDASIEGYAITVLDHEIMTVKDFYKKYNLDSKNVDDNFIKYYYVVKASFTNMNYQGNKAGVSINRTLLVCTTDYLIPDCGAFLLINPNIPSPSFSLKTNTSKEVILPYPINSLKFSSLDSLKKEDFKLQITEYPTRKLIKMKS